MLLPWTIWNPAVYPLFWVAGCAQHSLGPHLHRDKDDSRTVFRLQERVETPCHVGGDDQQSQPPATSHHTAMPF